MLLLFDVVFSSEFESYQTELLRLITKALFILGHYKGILSKANFALINGMNKKAASPILQIKFKTEPLFIFIEYN